MKFLSQDTLNDAVLFKLFMISQEHSQRVGAPTIAESFDFSVGVRRVELAFSSLAGRELVEGHETYARIDQKGYALVESELQDSDSFYSQYALTGDDWLSGQKFTVGGIPAADRVVSKYDNQAELEAIVENLEAIVDELDENNEIGAELGDEKELLKAEIEAGKSLTQNDKFRLRSLVAVLQPALKFLSEKFAGSAIGELAKKLIALLFNGF